MRNITSDLYRLAAALVCILFASLQFSASAQSATVRKRIEVTACDTFFFHGEFFVNSGIYQVNVPSNGSDPDTLYFVDVTILHLDAFDVSETACDSYVFGGKTLTENGTYIDTFTTSYGCDSIVFLHLTITHGVTEEIQHSSCQDTYMWGTMAITASGDYTQTFVAASGCDSVVTLHYTKTDASAANTEENITACDRYLYDFGSHQAEITRDTTFQTVVSEGECKSTKTTHITILHSSQAILEVEQWEPFSWGGTVYTESGVYTQSFTNWVGCDSIFTLKLTIHKTEYLPSRTITACDSIVVDGKTIRQNTTLVDTTYRTDVAGKIRTIQEVNYEILRSRSSEFTLSTCANSYYWNGVTYSEAGDYTQTLTSLETGCDSVVTLHLSFAPEITIIENVEACEVYYDKQMNAHTESGEIRSTHTSSAGCDSTHIIRLTIHHATSYDTTIVACDEVEFMSRTLTASGTYTFQEQTAMGCDSIINLHLTIHPSVRRTIDTVACKVCTWNGQTYTESGTYTYNGVTAKGCDSIVILSLTVVKNEPDILIANVAVNATAYCPGETVILSHQLISGEPVSYHIVFDGKAAQEGLLDIDGNYALNADIPFRLPTSIKAGRYTGTLQLLGADKKSEIVPFQVDVNLSSDLLFQMWEDVVAFDNSSALYSGFQWYKDGAELKGATDQFYCDYMGLDGLYSLRVTNSSGETLYVCAKEFHGATAPFSVSVSPNPVTANQPITVKVSGVGDGELANAKLFVYDTNGRLAYSSNEITSTCAIPSLASGEYILVVTIDYNQSANCKISVKP